MSYNQNFRTRQRQVLNTSQSQPIPQREASQVKMRSGGYAFVQDDFTRLRNFLILGTEQRTFYASAKELTLENVENIRKLVSNKEAGIQVVDQAVEVSREGFAPRNTPAVYTLALAAAFGVEGVSQYALAHLAEVARTATDFFFFVETLNAHRGFGRSVKRGVNAWYLNKSVHDILYQGLKYRNRNGWTHENVAWLSHTLAEAAARKVAPEVMTALKFITRGTLEEGASLEGELRLIEGYQQANAKDVTSDEVARLVRQYRLTHEMIPNQHLNSAVVWEAMLDDMPLRAMMRNLNKMTQIGLIKTGSTAEKVVLAKLGDEQAIAKARIHPMQMIMTMRAYQKGHSDYHQNSRWSPVVSIVDALDEGFYTAFKGLPRIKNVAGEDANMLVIVDTSSSMRGTRCAGAENFTVHTAGAIMSMALTHQVSSLTSWAVDASYRGDLMLSKRQRLDDIVNKLESMGGGSTDMAAGIQKMTRERLVFDTVVIYTDTESWAGNQHATQAWTEYRQKINSKAKLFYAEFATTGQTLRDPKDNSVLTSAGLSTEIPNLVAGLSAGKI